MRFAVVAFPGSHGAPDTLQALRHLPDVTPATLSHLETHLADFDAVVLPGGASFGDALRPGAIARFTPVMDAIRRFADSGGLVLGIGNGFQILCEAGLLPGAFLPNPNLRYRCHHTLLRTITRRSPFTRAIPAARTLRLPVAHAHGGYYADAPTLAALRAKDQVLWEYAASSPSAPVFPDTHPGGPAANIAGLCNIRRNVAGLMPHPERACDPLLGSEDGRLIFEGMLVYLREHAAARAA